MRLRVGASYIIQININGTLLTYTCKVVAIDGNFVSFIDKFDKEYTYNLNNVISFEEIKNA